MANTMDTDAGSEMFASYENELKLVQADLNQKLDQIAEASGEQRKSAIANAEQVLDEAMELVSAQHPEEGTNAPQDNKYKRARKEDRKLTRQSPI
jgi:vesicle transport through interaction with t-SNAREs protein 1